MASDIASYDFGASVAAELRAEAEAAGIEWPSTGRGILPIDVDPSLKFAKDIVGSESLKQSEQQGDSALVAKLGGKGVAETVAAVVNADLPTAESIIQLLNEDTKQQLIFQLLQSHREVIFQDDEVKKEIAQAFGVSDLQVINDALDYYQMSGGEVNRTKTSEEALKRNAEYERSFFQSQEVEDIFRARGFDKVDDNVLDCIYSATARFFNDQGNREEYHRVSTQYMTGNVWAVDSMRLQNKFLGILIQTVDRMAGHKTPAKSKKTVAAPKAKSDVPDLNSSQAEFREYFKKVREEAQGISAGTVASV